MAGAFVNKTYTLKSSESEELIFILANHNFWGEGTDYMYLGIRIVLENSVCESEFAHFLYHS